MAKYKRVTVGSVIKSKDKDKSDYIKIRGDMKKELLEAIRNMDEKQGLLLGLEDPRKALESLEAAVDAGKLSAEYAEKSRQHLQKTIDLGFVRFNVVLRKDA